MPRRTWLVAACIACTLLALLTSTTALAHGMRTAYVELREPAAGRIDVIVRSGASYGGPRVVMPPGCIAIGESAGAISSWSCGAPLRGSEVRLDGLGGIVSDAVVVAIPQGGPPITVLLRPGAATWTIPDEASTAPILARYARAGFLHVLGGADHLLFLAALVIAIRRFRAVVLAETAFTVSHSIALTATTLGWLEVPAAVAEAAIALSLVLVALDLGRRPMGAWTGARTALVFGAVHGLGFAGGLQELGVPRDAIVPALGGFAAGIEAAQVVFLLLCFAIHRAARRFALDRRLASVTAYAVGVTGCFWLIDRVGTLAGLR